MKTFNKTYIRVLDHLLGVEKHLSVFFPISLYLPAAYVYKNRKKAQTFTKSAVYGLGLFPSRPQGFLPSSILWRENPPLCITSISVTSDKRLSFSEIENL